MVGVMPTRGDESSAPISVDGNTLTHSAISDPEKKKPFERLDIFPTKYVIPKSLSRLAIGQVSLNKTSGYHQYPPSPSLHQKNSGIWACLNIELQTDGWNTKHIYHMYEN